LEGYFQNLTWNI